MLFMYQVDKHVMVLTTQFSFCNWVEVHSTTHQPLMKKKYLGFVTMIRWDGFTLTSFVQKPTALFAKEGAIQMVSYQYH